MYRLLVQAGGQGMSAGAIARATDSRPNTISTNLAILSAAQLVTSRRDGRSIIYSASYERLAELLAFVMEDESGTAADIGPPLLAAAKQPCD